MRVWAFQERLLSQRVLIYRKGQISCDCQTISFDSEGPLNPNVDNNESLDGPGRNLDHINLPAEPSSALLSPHMSFRSSAINLYSIKKISRPADKLKALSGLAKVVQRETGDTYMAGMWLSCLLQQLLWSAAEWPNQTHRSNLYLAPSWSWASMECSANLLGTLEHHPLAEVVRVYVKPVTKLDVLGEIQSGFLTIRGSLIQRLLIKQWARRFGVLFPGDDCYGERPDERDARAGSEVVHQFQEEIGSRTRGVSSSRKTLTGRSSDFNADRAGECHPPPQFLQPGWKFDNNYMSPRWYGRDVYRVQPVL